MKGKTFKVKYTQFYMNVDPRTHTFYVVSIHPYVDKEFHWARKRTDGCTWNIYREGNFITAIGGGLTEKQIAAKLMEMDDAAYLTKPRWTW